jgi:hypothetical protein
VWFSPDIDGLTGGVFLVERRGRTGHNADTTRRTTRDHAAFRPFDKTMSRVFMRRKEQGMRFP